MHSSTRRTVRGWRFKSSISRLRNGGARFYRLQSTRSVMMRGARVAWPTDADDVIASVVAAPHPVALCGRCAHGAAAAGGRPPLVYVGRGDGPVCARCAPSEAGGNNSRRYVVRVADRGAVGAEWLPFACVDDAAVAVEVDPAALDKRGALLPIPTEIVALAGRSPYRAAAQRTASGSARYVHGGSGSARPAPCLAAGRLTWALPPGPLPPCKGARGGRVG